MKFQFRQLLIYSIVTALIVSLSGCAPAKEAYTPPPVEGKSFYFDTAITLTLYGCQDRAILDKCYQMLQYYENLFSKTIAGSDIYQINHSGGKPVKVSDETITLLEKALYYHDLSEGKFNIAVGTLTDLWNVTGEAKAAPDQAAIDEAAAHTGINQLHIDGNMVTLTDAAAVIDLGAIAKGYVADRLKEYLQSQNIESALIDLGGNILTLGAKPDGSAWNIGIQYPFHQEKEPIHTLSVTGQSVVTSGIYERYFEENGTIYHHVIDPDTGYPSSSGLLSATIVSDSSLEGDALSTAVLLLGPVEGMALIEELEGIEAVLVDSDYQLLMSSGLK